MDNDIVLEDSHTINVISQRGRKCVAERYCNTTAKYKVKDQYIKQGSDQDQAAIKHGSIWTRNGRVIHWPIRHTY